jgi:hypothetical protein
MIEIDRDSALRSMSFSSDKPIAFTWSKGTHGEINLLNNIDLTDKTMTFLEEYFTKVINGTSRRFWRKPE